MVSDWIEVQLQDIVTKLGDGLHGTPKYSENGEYYFINGNNLENGQIVFKEQTKRVDHTQYLKYKKELNERTLLVSINGTIGNVAYYNGEKVVLGKSACYFNLKDDIDKGYVRYVLSGHYFQSYLHAFATGTTIKNVSLKSMREFSFPIPPLPEQKAIAHILGSLDDKIELNRQMNGTLEAMAQALFKSWFVDFDPVIDNALAAGNAIPDEFIERAEQRKGIEKKDNLDIQNLFPDEFEFTEEMGWTPKGWSVTSLENVCSKITDGSHSSPKSVDEGYPMASVKDMHSWGFDLNTCRKISEEDYHELRRNNCNPLKNDVLIAKDGSYLKHIFVVEEDLDLVVLSSIAMLRPNNNINPHFLSLTLKRKDVLRMMENYVSGAVLQRIVLRDFRKFLIVNPPIDIQTYWFKLVEGMFEASWNNIHSNNSLAKLRDTLLPKLMSGELRIPDSAVILEEF